MGAAMCKAAMWSHWRRRLDLLGATRAVGYLLVWVAVLLVVVPADVATTAALFADGDGDVDPLENFGGRQLRRMEVQLSPLYRRGQQKRWARGPATRRLLATAMQLSESGSSSEDDGWMSMDSFSHEGQDGDDWTKRRPTSGVGGQPATSVASNTAPTLDPTFPTVTDTTPVMCNVCDSVLLLSQFALERIEGLFELFEATVVVQSNIFSQQFSTNPVPIPSCGTIPFTEGNMAEIRFTASSSVVTLNSTRPPLMVLTTIHDSAFFQGIGALQSEMDVVTGTVLARRVQRVRGGEFANFPPTRLVCRPESNCDPSETQPPSVPALPMPSDTETVMVWPDPSSEQLNLGATIVLCDSRACQSTTPGGPELPPSCVDILNDANRIV